MKKDGRKAHVYAKLASALPIAVRPYTANNLTELGHFETDNMEGKKSDNTGVSVSVDRMSRITRLRKLADHKAEI